MRNISPYFFFKICFSLLFVVFISVGITAQTTVETLEHDGITRSYRIHLPPDFDPTESLPLVFNLHGYTSNAIEQEVYSGMNVVADSARFIVCYPDGVDEAWNAGWTFSNGVDDIGFISAMIDKFSKNYNINTNRVYSCGMSNGGFMSYHLACNLPDRIAAIASVTGSMPPGSLTDCTPDPARPILQIHGTEDETVPYAGNPFIALPIESVVSHWVEANGCLLVSDTTDYPDINTEDNSTASRIDYQTCDDHKSVSFIKVFNGGHTWPGASITFLGTTNQDFNASSTIWNFFNRFSLDGATHTSQPLTSSEWTVYPNPASDFLHLKVRSHKNNTVLLGAYKVIGTDGRSFTGKLHTTDTAIDIRTLATGIYWLQLSGQRPMKFIKD